MYCKNCGAKIKENTNFCQECGSKVNPELNDHLTNKSNAEKLSRAQNSVVKTMRSVNIQKGRQAIIAVAIVFILAVLIGVCSTIVRTSGDEKQIVTSSSEYYNTDGSLSSSYNYYSEYDNNGRIYRISSESSTTFESSYGSSMNIEQEEASINYTEMNDMYYGNGTAYDEEGEKQYEVQVVYDSKYNLLSYTKIYDGSMLSDDYEEYTYYDEKGRMIEHGFRENGENTEYFVYEYDDNDAYKEYYYFEDNLEYKKEGQLIRGNLFSGQVTEYDNNGDIRDIYNVTVDEVERNVYKQNDGYYETYHYYEGSSDRCIKIENYQDGILASKTENVYQ